MILDIARHKLYEALLTLVILALATVISAVATLDVATLDAATLAEVNGAPLGSIIHPFEVAHPILAAIVSFVLIVYLSFIATRSTVRTHIFGANSFATMTLVPLAIMGFASEGDMLTTALLAWLAVEALRRLFFAFGSEERLHAIFSGLLAVGAMPLLDSSMFVAVIALPMILVALRVGAREAIIAIVGMLLPIFSYAYVVWCMGGSFVEAIVEPYHNMLAPSGLSLVEYFAMPRMVLMATLLIATLVSVVLYVRNRLGLTLVSRHVWRFAIVAMTLLAASLVLLPSLLPASFVVLGVMMSMFAPMFFLRVNTLIAMALYILMICSSVAAMILP